MLPFQFSLQTCTGCWYQFCNCHLRIPGHQPISFLQASILPLKLSSTLPSISVSTWTSVSVDRLHRSNKCFDQCNQHVFRVQPFLVYPPQAENLTAELLECHLLSKTGLKSVQFNTILSMTSSQHFSRSNSNGQAGVQMRLPDRAVQILTAVRMKIQDGFPHLSKTISSTKQR